MGFLFPFFQFHPLAGSLGELRQRWVGDDVIRVTLSIVLGISTTITGGGEEGGGEGGW